VSAVAERAVTGVRFTVFGPAQPAGSKTIGRGPAGRVWVREAGRRSAPWRQQVAQVAGEAIGERELLDGPLAATMTFHVARPKKHYGAYGLLSSAPVLPASRPDLLKLARAVEDALTGVVYRDDAQIVEELLEKRYGEPARVEVWVGPAEVRVEKAGREGR